MCLFSTLVFLLLIQDLITSFFVGQIFRHIQGLLSQSHQAEHDISELNNCKRVYSSIAQRERQSRCDHRRRICFLRLYDTQSDRDKPDRTFK